MARWQETERPNWAVACDVIRSGPLRELIYEVSLVTDDLGKGDWAYVTNQGRIVINRRMQASPGEWVYILSHCLLHLGMDHIQKERVRDPLWQTACDLVVSRFLREAHIGKIPPEFAMPLPFAVKDEEQVVELLRQKRVEENWSTMRPGKPDMVWQDPLEDWLQKEPDYYPKLFASSLQSSMRRAVAQASGETCWRLGEGPWSRAAEWFLSSYPLLGALASSFRLVEDERAVRAMGISIAAVSPQMQEIYINPNVKLSFEEWKFVLAHEYLHAALRHDVRCEARDPELWNCACDFVINGWLTEMKVGEAPDGVLQEDRFKNLSAEAVYDIICQDLRAYRRTGTGDLVYGDPTWWDRLEGTSLDAWYRSVLQQGLQYHESTGRGLLPAGLIEEIRAVARPPIPWDAKLAEWFDQRFQPLERRRTYARLSRRQSFTPDIPRPAWRMEEIPEKQRMFGVVLDTSGSMDRGTLAAALGTIASYSAARDVRHVRVVFCDARAYDQGIMDPADIAGTVRIRGRGGTVLQPGLDLLDNDPDFPRTAPVLIITDGDCDRLNLRGREHAYLIPSGCRLPFPPKGPVFLMR